MLTAIILVIVGIGIAIACHHYVREPVFRFVGIALGVVVVAFGVYALITHSGAATDIDALRLSELLT